MGGYGSGRRQDKKTTVEECLVLSADRLTRDRGIREGLHAFGELTWVRGSTGEEVSSMGYEVDTRDRADPWIRVHYTRARDGDDMNYRIFLTTVPLPWGGVRWCFRCPQGGCGRRVSKLYHAPGRGYFGCRLCHNLTYTSSQEAHKYDGICRALAAEIGAPLAQVKDLMKT